MKVINGDEMNVEDAKSAYRLAWMEWCLVSDVDRKRDLESVMDGLQPHIANGPNDPPGVWKEFTASLPGYDGFWDGLRRVAEKISR